MAAIQDQNVKENLKYNYGVVFKTLLKKYSVLTKFQEDIGISKHRWYSACDGITYLHNDDVLYSKTFIDKSILKGIEKMKIKSEDYEIYEEDDQTCIDYIINKFKNNPEEAEIILKEEYSSNFRKALLYILSLTNKHPDTLKEDLKKVADDLNKISPADYLGCDSEILKKYLEVFDKHREILLAALVIKKYD